MRQNMKTKNKIPMRQCTGCREMKNKKEMMRILKTPENEIILDTTGRKNGRGAYLCVSMDCFEKAVKNHGIERSLKTAVPDEVYEELKKELENMRNASNKVLSLIGLASKAGRIASGEFSTEKSVKTGKAFLVFVAGDASENTKKKFRNMCDFYEVPVYFLADKEALGRFCGKQFRASLAVQDENFAKAMIKELERSLT